MRTWTATYNKLSITVEASSEEEARLMAAGFFRCKISMVMLKENK